MTVAWPLAAIGISIAVVAAIVDMRTGKIPNMLTVIGMTAGLVGGAIFGGLQGAMMAIVGGLAAAIVPLLLFRAGAMGGGDVKLLAALGALLGLEMGLELETMAFLTGSAQGVFVWIRQGRMKAGLCAVASLALPFAGARLRRRQEIGSASRTSIRFGPAILVGTIAAFALRAAG